MRLNILQEMGPDLQDGPGARPYAKQLLTTSLRRRLYNSSSSEGSSQSERERERGKQKSDRKYAEFEAIDSRSFFGPSSFYSRWSALEAPRKARRASFSAFSSKVVHSLPRLLPGIFIFTSFLSFFFGSVWFLRKM